AGIRPVIHHPGRAAGRTTVSLAGRRTGVMRWLLVGMVALGLAAKACADGPPLVEKYLHAGELARGEKDLVAALEATPKDDQLRFGLGVLRFVRGVERLGQGLYRYGVRSEYTNLPFLRLP